MNRNEFDSLDYFLHVLEESERATSFALLFTNKHDSSLNYQDQCQFDINMISGELRLLLEQAAEYRALLSAIKSFGEAVRGGSN